MAIDLYADIVQSIAAPLEEWLLQQGAEPELKLAPPTREGAGDLAVPCHRYAKALRKPPQAIAEQLAALALASPWVAAAEPAAGFLNLRLNWVRIAERAVPWAQEDDGAVGRSEALKGRKIVIEYSSPNTNKPQHLGHCRNNILGHTLATLMEAAGAEVVRVNLINDRGIHICKSMVAWRRFGEGATPESTGLKGDHLVGAFYVRFDQAFKAEYSAAFPEGGGPDHDVWFNTQSALGTETRDMLRAWEAGDPEVLALWRTMNGWCEAGFFETYARMGVKFDQIDRESQTWLLGKELVGEGLENGTFRRLDDGAVVFDLERLGLEGQKVVQRSDGTTLYVTQDLGTALQRFERHQPDQMIYVVGNEQDRHFQVLFGMLAELRPALKGRLFHLSYGMVELPDGKMKSREGTVVDADDLMNELRDAALEVCQESENLKQAGPDALAQTAESIGLSGLKFFLLKYAPPTTFIFDKERSIKPQGETGVYCQYAAARAGRVLEKLGTLPAGTPDWRVLAEEKPRAVLQALLSFPGEVQAAAIDHKPNLVAKALYAVAHTFAELYNDHAYRVLGAEAGRQLALAGLVTAVHRVLEAGLALLGIRPVAAM
jgi:arginyl-tRNA synthetase